jgi:hypothetical protein
MARLTTASVLQGGKPRKLQPVPVPAPLWEISAYRILNRRAPWKHIREAALESSGHRCSICGVRPQPGVTSDWRLYCHEDWHYDDSKSLATLQAFEILCADCNSVTHMGRASALGYLDQSVKHLCRVNGIAEAQAVLVFRRAMDTWKERSKKQWRVAVSRALLARYPQLQVLDGRLASASPSVQPPD